jgi:predicted transcriptional regulator
MPEIFLGDLSQVKLFDILKPLLMGKKTGKLSFKGRENGEMYLETGDIVHARTPDSSGEYSFFTIMGWKTGRITFEPDESPPERTIPIPSEQLLLNWSSKKIEWERVRERIPSNSAVFCLSLQNNGESKTLSAEQWNVLALSNGTRNVSEIARVLNWDEFKVVKAIYQLVRAGLMEQVGEQQPAKKKLVRENFFFAIEKELKKVMGAVSSFIIDDRLKEFGEKRESFPQEKLLSFVEALGEEIPQDDKRKEFKKAVMEFFSLEK